MRRDPHYGLSAARRLHGQSEPAATWTAVVAIADVRTPSADTPSFASAGEAPTTGGSNLGVSGTSLLLSRRALGETGSAAQQVWQWASGERARPMVSCSCGGGHRLPHLNISLYCTKSSVVLSSLA